MLIQHLVTFVFAAVQACGEGSKNERWVVWGFKKVVDPEEKPKSGETATIGDVDFVCAGEPKLRYLHGQRVVSYTFLPAKRGSSLVAGTSNGWRRVWPLAPEDMPKVPGIRSHLVKDLCYVEVLRDMHGNLLN